MKVQSLSRVQLLVTPWTAAYQAPPSMGFSRQECWSGLPFPSPLPDPGIEPRSPALQADALPSEPPGKPRQEYWRLANAGCHTLLEHYISCCPSHQFLSTWCCQNPHDPSSCTTSTPGPHRDKAKSSRAALGANPRGQPTCRGGNKTTETQGQCD